MPQVPYEQAVAALRQANPNPKDYEAAKKVLDGAYGMTGGLSGTGAPAPGALPPLSSGPTASPNLPAGGGKPNSILEFANTLEQAVQLAREGRNKSSVDMMAPYRGTAAASDFNSILGNLNAASDKTSENLIKKATELSSPDIVTTTNDNGDVSGIDRNTGQVIWTAKGVGNKQTGGGGGGSGNLIKSGALTYTREDYSDDASSLEESRGADGWVDPTMYQTLYDNWVSSGGKIADFVKTFPPAQYVNPENDWLPPYLRPKASGTGIPSSFSSLGS